MPTTRALTWPVAIEKIKQHPWVGEGPFFVNPEAGQNLGMLPGDVDPYPHSLYLFLLRTIGIVGLVPILWFFMQSWRLLYQSQRRAGIGSYTSAILRVGMLLIPAFLIAQVTLEFNRPTTIDYAQFIFALVGLLVGVADRSSQVAPARLLTPQKSAMDWRPTSVIGPSVDRR